MSAEFSLASYSRTIAGDLYDLDSRCALVLQLSRHFHSLAGAEQAAALLVLPLLTGSRWDALLAALVEHAARLHRDSVPEWINEPASFLYASRVISADRAVAADSVPCAPARFIPHGVFSDARDLTSGAARSMPGLPESVRPLDCGTIQRAFGALGKHLRST